MKSSPWLVNPRFDFVFFLAPALVGLLAAVPAMLGYSKCNELAPWAWVLCVVLVDVAHVWASLFRVYLDPIERRRRALYWMAPLGIFIASALIHALSSSLFWTVLAYVAVFHFIKQQYGFVSLYREKADQTSRWDRLLDKVTVWVGTGVPVLWWHCNLPRQFSWFMEGDFIAGLPGALMNAIWPIYALVALLWSVHRLYTMFTTRQFNVGRDSTMLLTWLIWYVGIVPLNLDSVFTVTNVLLHGIPYAALVWITSRPPEAQSQATPSNCLAWLHKAPRYILFLMFLALCEEALWDVLHWHEHAQFFGDWSIDVGKQKWISLLAVPLLTVPQGTHYLLDGFIWRMDGSNPGLRERISRSHR